MLTRALLRVSDLPSTCPMELCLLAPFLLSATWDHTQLLKPRLILGTKNQKPRSNCDLTRESR